MHKKRNFRYGAASLLMFLLIGTVLADAPPTSQEATFHQTEVLKADVSTLKDTRLVVTPDAPLVATQNVLWCGTLQLAWNEAIALVGEKLQFTRSSQEVDQLNRQNFTKENLDSTSYVAIADFESNGVENEIKKALQETFQVAASPSLIPLPPAHPGPDDFVAYAYLFKSLAFPLPFAENKPLSFGGNPVRNFGFMENANALDAAVFSQVQIMDYVSQDDFIISLKTKSPEDQLILAKVPPQSTLGATVQNVLERVKKGTLIAATDKDRLAVPKLNFDLESQFPELEGLELNPSPTARVHRLRLSSVRQDVRFQLNEQGVKLKSEAEMTMRATAIMLTNQPYELIFDQPFLILIKRTSSPQPYFALWVGNSTLLVPAP
jgi:hypothetical protein